MASLTIHSHFVSMKPGSQGRPTMAGSRRGRGEAEERQESPVVSSAHLAAGAAPALSEAEFGLILAGQAFQRWMVRCMAAAGMPGLSPVEVLVLHTVHHRNRPKRQAEILLAL